MRPCIRYTGTSTRVPEITGGAATRMRSENSPDSPSQSGGGRWFHSSRPVARSKANRRRSGIARVIGMFW